MEKYVEWCQNTRSGKHKAGKCKAFSAKVHQEKIYYILTTISVIKLGGNSYSNSSLQTFTFVANGDTVWLKCGRSVANWAHGMAQNGYIA